MISDSQHPAHPSCEVLSEKGECYPERPRPSEDDPPTESADPLPAAWLAPDPDAHTTSPEAVYQAARRYVAAGLSVIPIEAETGEKSPDRRRLPRYRDPADGCLKSSWKIYQVRRPSDEELRRWYEASGRFGIAVIGGAVSGGSMGCGLEIIDFDTAELAGPWTEAVNQRIPGLVERLVRIQSPRPGLHVYYRCRKYGGSQKLACAPGASENETVRLTGAERLKRVTLVELKGEGGYCIVPPSPRRVHPRNRLYRLVEGSPDLTQVPTISGEERAVLLEEARQLNQWVERQPAISRKRVPSFQADGGRPGDDFNRRAEWAQILEPHGWHCVGRRGETEDWCRPGKESGVSATVNYAASDLLYVFSSNADPFEGNRAYTKFAAYALLHHGGDFHAAAQELRVLGYGRQELPLGRRLATLTTARPATPR